MLNKIIMLALCLAPLVAQSEPYCVVTSNETAAVTLDSDTLGRLFLGKVQLVDGVRLTPAHGELEGAAEQAFLKDVLGLSAEQYSRHWRSRLYSSRGTPPRTFNSAAKLIEFAQRTPGVIALLPADGPLAPGLRYVAFAPTDVQPAAPPTAAPPTMAAPPPATAPAPAPAPAPATAPPPAPATAAPATAH